MGETGVAQFATEMTIMHRNKRQNRTRSYQPRSERLETRRLMSYADGNGAVITGVTEQLESPVKTLVISFDGPLTQSQAETTTNYRVNGLPKGISPEIVTKNGPADQVISASYNATTFQVTLTLAKPLKAGTFYRVMVNGTPGSGIVDGKGNTIDGDNDDTPAGNFFGLVAAGGKLNFVDADSNPATVKVTGGGRVNLWRELNGDVDQLSVLGAVDGQTTLNGFVVPKKGSDGLVVIPSTQGLTGVNNELPPTFVSQAPTPPASPTPVVATTQNLPYSLTITPVSIPSVPTIQSAVYTQSGGKWLVFGGRTNGLHNFTPDGITNFPPRYQNNDIFVIDPKTGQTWTKSWDQTGVSPSVYASLASTNQEYYRAGDRLYTIGGYSYSGDGASMQFQTHDTLSAISVSGLINAVINNGNVAAQIKQISDPRFEVTGGELNRIGNRMFLDFGQDFQGGYNGNTASISQVYTDEVRSFRILDHGNKLAIKDYQAQRDPVNFRRRDGNLAQSTITAKGQTSLTAFGGVFTVPAGGGYRLPIVIGQDGFARVDYHYQQYFSQYTGSKAGLYSAKSRAMTTVFFGGISLYDYSFSTGTLTQDTELPFVDDVTSLVQGTKGSTQEYIMPSQLPSNYGPYDTTPPSTKLNLYGAEATFFVTPGLPAYSNGVLKFDKIKNPIVLGYIYGGIVADTGNFGNSTSSGAVFQVILTPN